MTHRSPANSVRASVFWLMSITSSDSGVIISTEVGSRMKRFFCDAATSPCHLKTSSPTMRAYDVSRSSWLLRRARIGHT